MMNSTNYSWFKSDIEILIETYKKYPIVYNWKHEDYTKPYKKQAAWNELTAEMQKIKPTITTDIIKRKIKSLKRKMAVEMKKKKDYRIISDKEYIPKLWFYKNLEFLLQHSEEFMIFKNEVLKTTENSRKRAAAAASTTVTIANRTSVAVKPKVSQLTITPHNLNESKRPRYDDAKLERLMNRADASIDLLNAVLRKAHKERIIPKTEHFRQYICSELDDLNETYDEVKQQIITVIMNAKAREKITKQFTN